MGQRGLTTAAFSNQSGFSLFLLILDILVPLFSLTDKLLQVLIADTKHSFGLFGMCGYILKGICHG